MMSNDRAGEAMFGLGGGPASGAPAAARASAVPSTPGTSPAASAASAPEAAGRLAATEGTGAAEHVAGDTRDVADAIRVAAARGTPLRIRAGGGWLDAGRPIAPATDILDVRALQGIVEYTPGDLTITVRGATTLAEIDEATRAHGQWLPLDPFGAPTDTVGATLATASYGPLAASQGLPRDLALGVEFVDGRGVVVRGGGRVVKNVAGFDLVRLTIGAWGTLGVITEATLRLRARPAHVATLALPAPRTAQALATLLHTLRGAALTALACELVDAALAHRLGAGHGDDDVVLVRLAGNPAGLSAQRALLTSLGAGPRAVECPDELWTAVRRAIPAGHYTLRCSRRPSALAELWHECARLAPPNHALRHASVERGVVRLAIAPDASLALATIVPEIARSATVVGERLDAHSWSLLPDPHAGRLAAGIRRTFDPDTLLNPTLPPSSVEPPMRGP